MQRLNKVQVHEAQISDALKQRYTTYNPFYRFVEHSTFYKDAQQMNVSKIKVHYYGSASLTAGPKLCPISCLT